MVCVCVCGRAGGKQRRARKRRAHFAPVDATLNFALRLRSRTRHEGRLKAARWRPLSSIVCLCVWVSWRANKQASESTSMQR